MSTAALKIPAPLLIATGAIFILVDVGMLSLRVWARRLKNIELGPDDYTCMASCLLAVGMSITVMVEASRKTIGYQSDAPLTSDATNAEYAFYPSVILGTSAVGFVKLSFLLFYQRIFVEAASPIFFHTCTVVIVCTAIWTVAFTFAWIFACGKDPWIFWHSFSRRQGNCVNITNLTYALAIPDFLFDIVIIGLPVTRIWRLKLSPARKFQLSGIFLLGGVTIAASCVRLAVFVESEAVLQAGVSDFESLDTNAIYWSLIETGLAIVAACLPTLSYLVTNEGLRSAVESVRSALSLHSLFSDGSRRHEVIEGAEGPAGLELNDQAAQDAYRAMTRSGIGETNTHLESGAAYEMPRIPETALKQVDGIVVSKTLTQSSELAQN